MPNKLNYNRPQFNQEVNELTPRDWTFSFGLYRGKSIYAVPTEYLIKLRGHCKIMSICERCSNEIERRKRIAKQIDPHNYEIIGPSCF
jgi:hypothetical protein